MYTRSGHYYDALYAAMGKDYAAEAERIAAIAAEHSITSGKALLDVACGTGRHIEHLRARFDCEGLDLDRTLLNIAAKRNPGIQFYQADMIGFNLDKRFDVITCLFSSIGYAPNVQRLQQTMQTFVRHLRPGGIVMVEPWIRPNEWADGSLHALYVDEPDLKVSRMSVSRRDGNVSILNFHYMVGLSDGIRTFTEPHRLTLFTDEEYREAFRRAGLRVRYDEKGLMGRGLYIGTRDAGAKG